MPRPSLHCFVFVGACLALPACTTGAERRESIQVIAESWRSEVLAEEQDDLLDNVRALGAAGREGDDWLLSLTLLARLAFENPSGLVRAESLAAAWKLAADLPTEAVPTSGLEAQALQERMRRFETLDDARQPAQRDEWLALAGGLAAHRFAPSPDPRQRGLALDLCELMVSRAFADEDDSLRRAIEPAASGSARHALSLITLYAADDLDSMVRETALRVVRHLDPPAALNLITGALTIEDDTQVLLAAVDSLGALSDQFSRRDVLATLSGIGRGSDLALRRAADSLAERVGR
jgi:hypothetical protein